MAFIVCDQCGIRISSLLDTCPKCGNPLGVSVKREIPSTNMAHSVVSKRLVYGDGQDSSARIFWFLVYFALGSIAAWLCFNLGSKSRISLFGVVVYDSLAKIFYTAALVVFAIGLCMAIFTALAIAKTSIVVYDNRVEGIGVGKYFHLGDLRTFQFQLSYDQISSVDLSGAATIINAYYTHYKCYVANGARIQDTIFIQRNKRD